MTDGKTELGNKPVELDGLFTLDECLMFERSLDMALMIDSHEVKPPHPQRMDWVAARLFLKNMRDTLHKAMEEQYPEELKELGP